MMKILQKLILFIFILCSIGSFAQTDEETKPKGKTVAAYPKNEIRLIFENFFGNNNYDFAYNSNQQYYPYEVSSIEYFNNKFRYGLGYNLNFNKIGFRSKLFYNNYSESSTDFRFTNSDTKSNQFRGTIGINYQKHLNNKVVLFVGADFGYFVANLSQNSITQQGYKTVQNLNYSGITIQPLFGFKFFINENFSISSEIRFLIDNYKGDSEYTTYDYTGNSTSGNIHFSGMSYQLAPKGSISLNVHF